MLIMVASGSWGYKRFFYSFTYCFMVYKLFRKAQYRDWGVRLSGRAIA
jgi:hypothetical protein